MIIEIETKGGGLAATFDAVQGPVPRAGDVLASGDYAALLNGPTTVLVVTVVYEHTGQQLTPRVRCRSVDDVTGDRLYRLEEHGWLRAPD
jgi:hypothetical protein